MEFIRQEVALQEPDQCRVWQAELSGWIGHMLENGMPMEQLGHLITFGERNRQAIHAEVALLVMLDSAARVTQEPSSVEWPNQHSAANWLARILPHEEFDGLAFRYPIGWTLWTDVSVVKASLRSLTLTGSAANLFCANLLGVDLTGANLSRAFLLDADLRLAILSRADLTEAILSRANLHSANLIGANLIGANLGGADLGEADLSEADLRCADLSGADLSGANLIGAKLIGAKLSDADLSGADLSGADLREVDLRDVDPSHVRNLASAILSTSQRADLKKKGLL